MASPQVAPSNEEADRIISDYLKGKDQQWKAFFERKGRLTLLELPVDILRLIVREITHTNDLTALALANSALYNLAVPLIYSRFDIVWPDGNTLSAQSKNVDALTYGLSTLCLGSAFARSTRKAFQPVTRPLAKFAGNEYAKYIKKFSLGNGPGEWVNEYMITKESGKMLGTLVAIAATKMKNLETFVWDMPTGVLSDIFMALASQADQPDRECKLSRVWIRWHDNSDPSALLAPSNATPVPVAPALVPVGSQLTPIGIMLPENASHPTPRGPLSYSQYPCEYPTFSVLPPLKSLTVLDIDELTYLDEMAVLIERSKDSLQELRVGISAKASHKDFVQTWDGPTLRQIDHKTRWPGESTIGERRLGGVLGVLVGHIYDIRKRVPRAATPTATPSLGTPSSAQAAGGQQALPKVQTQSRGSKPAKTTQVARKRLDGKLKLQTLELERIPLSMAVCRHAIDWTVLSSLTLLDCSQHENLWKMLRKQFVPRPTVSDVALASSNRTSPPESHLQYHLALKYIHTDTTTPALVSFLKETLAPNSLEVLFLQDRRRTGSGPPPVILEVVFKALKRHRLSLRKLLLDSSAKQTGIGSSTTADNTRWRAWVLTTDVLRYITSGRMKNLRELAVSIDYKDWHTFLQRLPNLAQLRSINIPHLADYVTANFEPKELANQIADIITLKPEIRLCYAGIANKCFEILETCDTGPSSGATGAGYPDGPIAAANVNAHVNGAGANGDNAGHVVDEDEDETTSEEDDGGDNAAESTDEDEDDNTPTTATSDPEVTQSDNEEAPADEDEDGEDSDDQDDDDDGFVEPDLGKVTLRIREILFYDDKVAIFRARHGRL
ncbi:hypothetical protein B0T24DRAFT_372810 [Lasiosphaeria ovina]|uniref:F-box domain-containing protein n=1 Tax=Lasiosphaeria ovina TaxID=92902 RepID=A0AAE0N172_9PEZI|nr:hypothetical protein B0T24DRAFT_372810 [Lasiosphaeria ovina]